MGYLTQQVTVSTAAVPLVAAKQSRSAVIIRVVSGGDIRVGPAGVTQGGTPATAGLLVKLTDTFPTVLGSTPNARGAAADAVYAIRDAAVDAVVSVMEVFG